MADEKMSAEDVLAWLRAPGAIHPRTGEKVTHPKKLAAADLITALQREADEARAKIEYLAKVRDDQSELIGLQIEKEAAAQSEASRLREALEPFADFALVSVNATGWINRAGNELIQDWFHPAAFFKAFKAHRGSGPIPTVAEMPAALSTPAETAAAIADKETTAPLPGDGERMRAALEAWRHDAAARLETYVALRESGLIGSPAQVDVTLIMPTLAMLDEDAAGDYLPGCYLCSAKIPWSAPVAYIGDDDDQHMICAGCAHGDTPYRNDAIDVDAAIAKARAVLTSKDGAG